MKPKRILGIAAGILLLVLAVYAGYRQLVLSRVNDFQPMQIMVDGVLYQLDEVLNGGPSSRPDGILTEFVGNRIPEKDGEFNFAEPGIPYWKTHDGICVYVNENYLLFKVQE